MIEINNVSKSFAIRLKKHPVLREISLHIKGGEIFGLLGPNGSGKTTLMKVLLGFIRPDEGTVLINDQHPESVEVKKIIGYLPENPALYPYLTGEETLYFCGELCGMEKGKIKEKTRELLEIVDLWGERKKPLRYYSKGMTQRIALAQALIHNPDILFFDEPLSGLDPLGRKMIKDLIVSLKKAQKTIFINSHILNDLELLCDQIGILYKGKIIKKGRVETLTRTHSLEEVFLKAISEHQHLF